MAGPLVLGCPHFPPPHVAGRVGRLCFPALLLFVTLTWLSGRRSKRTPPRELSLRKEQRTATSTRVFPSRHAQINRLPLPHFHISFLAPSQLLPSVGIRRIPGHPLARTA